ncbi:spore coat protein H [Entomortierella parvispora]|uniref:Spore coat protein H n=1 Tax=Entomortierella parvispora TaxID=205924 RepID=A0A9P3HK40_9FUNG|nr:spore coat protein H [Entomortierella parvispora]
MVRIVAGLAGLATLASVSMAQIAFNVVGYPSATTNSFGVSINGQITKLVANETTFPVWTGVVPGTTSAVQYQYVEIDATGAAVKTENFTRTLPKANSTHTYNEFFQRQVTKWELPHIPYTYLATWPSYTKVFNDDEIATIHVTADPSQIAALNANPNLATDIKVDFRWIDHHMIYDQKNITFKTSGKSSKDYQKQAYKFSFDTDYNQTFFSRPNLKLRSEATDPTVMREKIYIDMLNAVGVPTQQGAYVRLFVNNNPFGLYLMVDDIKKSFIKQTVYGGNPNAAIGSLVQMNAPSLTDQADLVYKGATNTSYNPDTYTDVVLGNNTAAAPLTQLIQFMLDLQNFDPVNTTDPIGYWNNTRLDLDGFLRNMACEYLMGSFDAYWMSASNYFLYFNPSLGTSGKWQWLPTDFDGTFGNGFPVSTLSSYETLYNFQPDHPLVSKLIIKNTAINGLFQQILTEIVGTSFKPAGLFPRIATYNQMLSADYLWDTQINRTGPGLVTGYTWADFNNNLDNITKDMQYSVRGWIHDMSQLVATQLNFTINNSTTDRVPPPPKPTKGGDDDVKGGKGGGKKNSALALNAASASGFLTVFVLVGSMIAML